jgi:hypothetical protein
MKIKVRETACPRTASIEAWGDLRPQGIFRCENRATSTIHRGLPAAMEQDSRSGQHLPPPHQRPEHGIQGHNRIQTP